MAYFVGQLGNTLPRPGRVGGVEGAMVAAPVAFGEPAGLAIAGVLTYRALAFWLPTVPGVPRTSGCSLVRAAPAYPERMEVRRMADPHWHALERRAALAEVREPGRRAVERGGERGLERFGPNRIAPMRPEPAWVLLWRQLSSPLILVLHRVRRRRAGARRGRRRRGRARRRGRQQRDRLRRRSGGPAARSRRSRRSCRSGRRSCATACARSSTPSASCPATSSSSPRRTRAGRRARAGGRGHSRSTSRRSPASRCRSPSAPAPCAGGRRRRRPRLDDPRRHAGHVGDRHGGRGRAPASGPSSAASPS